MANILLAEDDRSMRTFVAAALEKSGHKVTSCADGTEALAALECGATYDLLLTDIVMPGMDGLELSARAGALSPKTKVMFITGFAAVTLKAGKAVPQAKVLSKPFHLRDLVLEIDRMFGSTSLSELN